MKKKRVSAGGGRVYRYVFPPLAEARHSFAAGLAVTPEWDDVDDWQEQGAWEPLIPQ